MTLNPVATLPQLAFLVARQPDVQAMWEADLALLTEDLNRGGVGHARAGKLCRGSEGLRDLVDFWAQAGSPGLAWTSPALWAFAVWATEQAAVLQGGEWSVLPATAAWRTEPGQRGWPLHRDHPAYCFDPDGKPIMLTFWCAVSGGTEGEGGVRVYEGSERKEPAEAGQCSTWVTEKTGHVYVWNHAVLHEGLSVRTDVRRAFAVELVRKDYAGAAALDPKTDEPDLTGLALYSRTRYQHYSGASPLVRLTWEACQRDRKFGWGPELGGRFDVPFDGESELGRYKARLRAQTRGFSPILTKKARTT